MKTNETTTQETVKRPRKRTNDILEDHGEWLLVDISTPKFPNATMAVDADVFNAHEGGRIHPDCSGRSKNIYAIYKINGFKKYLHRDVIDIPYGLVIDHVFHYPYEFVDNRRENLRAITQHNNSMNNALSCNNTSGVTGVYLLNSNNRWRSIITINGKHKHLGYFTNKLDAIDARKEAERKYFGDYAFQGAE